MVEKGKSKAEVAELLEIGIVQMAKKESCWLKPAKNGNFIRKIDP
ncbi:hypothetical protein [Candidatus Mesenet endosymbiont of Phosphuga atrata]